MRILFAFVGGNGHLQPLIPIARAVQAAGHTVAFTGRPRMVPTVHLAGFDGFATGADYGDSDERSPLLPVDLEREGRDLREGFARRLARERAPAVGALCEAWKPDVVVCDEVDFGTMIAAERLGLPYAVVIVLAAGSFVWKYVIGDALNEVRAEFGLPPDPELAMLHRYLVLSPVPPGYRDPASPLPETAHAIRPAEAAGGLGEPAPAWLAAMPHQRTVYFTLGTIFNRESGDLFWRVREGVRELPVNVIMTVGPHIYPEEFGAQPEHVHIAQYIPQAQVLPYCDAVITHGGSGSVIGALAYGLPAVLLPMGADQPLNAARCAALGVGIVLDAVTATPEIIREAVAAVMDDPSYRLAAERLRDEIATLPRVEEVVSLIEGLAAEKRTPTA